MEILCIRHGEDLGAINGIIDDLGLTELGKKQVQNIKTVVNEFRPDYIVSSPLKRALETAEIINEDDNKEIKINHLLTEMNFLNLQDIDKTELIKFNTKLDASSGFIDLNERIKNGESHQDLINRIKEFWEELKKDKKRKNSKIVIIAHGRLLTFLISYVMELKLDGYRFAIPNAGYIKLKIYDNWRPQLSFCNVRTG